MVMFIYMNAVNYYVLQTSKARAQQKKGPSVR